jgi:hypothetical protein
VEGDEPDSGSGGSVILDERQQDLGRAERFYMTEQYQKM